MFVRVAIPIPSSKAFIYTVSEEYAASATIGKRVVVPLGIRRLTGWVVEILTEAATEQNIKEIISVPDGEPLFSRDDLLFFEWISEYYLYPLGMVLAEVLPGGINAKSHRWVRLAAHPDHDKESLTKMQTAILERLASSPRGLSVVGLGRALRNKNLPKDIRFLESAGLITAEEMISSPALMPKQEKWIGIVTEIPADLKLTEKQTSLLTIVKEKENLPLSALEERFREASFLRNLKAKGVITIYEKEVFRGYVSEAEIIERQSRIILNNDQKTALDEIKQGLSSEKFVPYLLYGVTGSGKTEIYLRAMNEVIKNKGSAIYLVPEIALTAQLISRVKRHFPEEQIAVLHSGIPNNARYDQWRKIKKGEIRLIIGARSAIFAPAQDLRLIIVDEEHDTSYKQDDRLRYNGRDLALVRGKKSRAVVILGSATPGIQTYFYAKSGIYKYLHLPLRVNNRSLPKVETVDMKKERDQRGKLPIFSRRMIEALGETLQQRKQALLFLNRRGFHTFVFCSECGHVFNCPSCDLALTYHAAQGVLKCHHCDFTTSIPTICPVCGSSRIHSQGAGTERIEGETKRLFPDAVVARIDSDISSRKGDSERILKDFSEGKIDILVGTQIIAKGHDFPEITFVGVLAADSSLNIPDFRAAERTFQLLAQVSGRGGRGDQPGLVVVQTFTPDHYSIRRAQEHDYEGFYNDEMPFRQQLNYPPYSRLIGLHFSSLSKEKGARTVVRIGEAARRLALTFADGKADIIGPAESPLPRIRGRYRWQMLVRGKDGKAIHSLTKRLLEGKNSEGLEIRVDVDPVHFM
jgi:primosomal protein N' (replication factor Y)